MRALLVVLLFSVCLCQPICSIRRVYEEFNEALNKNGLTELQKKVDLADFCNVLPEEMRPACNGSEFDESQCARRDAKGFKCDLCVFVVKACENWLLNDSTIDALRQRLMSLCKEPYYDVCVATVNYSLEKITELLETAKSPESICGTMGMCK